MVFWQGVAKTVKTVPLETKMAMKAAVFSRSPRRIPVEKKNILETFI
jgi:hypothetical protein